MRDFSHKHRYLLFLKKLSSPALLCSLMLVMSACSGNRHDDLDSSAVITFSAPGFYLPPGSQLKWRSDLVYLFDDARKKPEDTPSFLQQEIQDYLEQNGYVFPGDGSAGYGLVAVVILGDGLTAEQVLQRFRLTPSFEASRRYEKGTIVIAVYDTSNKHILWRGALQANVNLELAVDKRRDLVREHIRKLLSTMPTRQPT